MTHKHAKTHSRMLIGLKVREETDVRTDGQTDTTDFVTRLAYAIGKIIQRIKKIFYNDEFIRNVKTTDRTVLLH